jgi:hypothetical protein
MKKNLLFGVMIVLASCLTAANTIDNAFFDKVKFRGAFGTTDWTTGWSNFDPQNTVYSATTDTIQAGSITENKVIGSPFMAAASFTETELTNSFFTPVNYVGAFGQTDWTATWANFDPQNTVYSAPTVTISAGEITANTTWTKNNVYLLNGWVYVKSGVTLTIEAGTLIRGDKTNKGALIIEKGAQLIANGTAAEPIVFTSNQPVGGRTYGDWGGVIICGQAPINVTGGSATIEGGVGSTYGGAISNDNSGSLQYVRIEFPGIAFAANNEINGLTMGGVGSATTVDYIQVSYSGDDSFEWFGGVVNAKHLIAFRGWDDDFDTDFGYSGMVQFAVSLRDPAIADQSKSNSFESDNDASGSTNTPVTSPVFCNVSSFGPLVTSATSINALYQAAMHLRRNSKIKIFNSVFEGWPKGLIIDATTTQNNAINGDLKLKNVVMSGMTTNFAPTTTGPWTVATDEQSWFETTAFGNKTYSANYMSHLKNPFNLSSPDFRPASSYLLNGWAYVINGVTLTIEPGMIIRGDKTNKGALIVEKGAKLIAKGTSTSPIVFTSNQAAGGRTYGDWGGVILCGQAPINVSGGSATIEGGVGSTYGGIISDDNSGTLQYVRIEFPGIAFAANNEINGLTMGGVGSATTVDHIQVSYSGDDSYEWFGGTVNAKYLIAHRGWDDDFDTDFGFSGMVQYAVSLRDPDIADQSKSNSFESDNDGSGTSNSPFTTAVFSNVSSFGPLVTSSTTINALYQAGMHIRRNSKLQIYNSVFAGWPKGLIIDAATTQNNAINGELKLRNSMMSGMTTFFAPTVNTWTSANDERNWYNTGEFLNDTVAANTDLKVANAFSLTAPNFLPTSKSKLLNQSNWYFTPATGLANNMTLYVNAYANGTKVTDAGSMLMAYKGEECRGSVEVINDGSGMFMLTAMSNETSESDLDLKLYTRSNRKTYDLPVNFDFVNNSDLGLVGTPATVTATAGLTIPLVQGTNWISYNVLPEDNTMKNALAYTASNGDVITRQGGTTASYVGTNWIGVLNEIAKDKMYKLKCTSAIPGSIQLGHNPLVKNNPVSYAAGVNWIGYSPVESMSVSSAFAGYTASINDKVTTNAGGGSTATYTGASWLSAKPTMYPGRGYTLTSSTTGTFSFPARTLSNSTPNRVSAETALTNTGSPWAQPVGKANNMTVYAFVYMNGVKTTLPAGFVLGTFNANGSASPANPDYCYGVETFIETDLGAGTVQLFMYGVQDNFSEKDGYYFKAYDPASNKIYDVIQIPDQYDKIKPAELLDDKFNFINDGALGEVLNPVVLNINTLTTTVDQTASKLTIFNNSAEKTVVFGLQDFNSEVVSVDICDVQGKVVSNLYNGVSNGANLTFDYTYLNKGIYFAKTSVNGVIKTYKLIF